MNANDFLDKNLSTPEKLRFVTNVHIQDDKYGSFHGLGYEYEDVINECLNWSITPEGFEYWREIHNRVWP